MSQLANDIGGPEQLPTLSISSHQKKLAPTPSPQLYLFPLYHAMSPRSRGVISRVLTSYRLSRSSKPCHRQLVITLFQQSRIAPPGPVSASCFHPPRLNLPRYFSTTGIRQSQTPQGDVTSILPTCCPGCGAFTQTIEPNEPGYYSKSRKHTRRILASRKNADEQPTTQAGDEVLSAEGDNREAVAQPTREIEEELTAPKPFQGSTRRWHC